MSRVEFFKSLLSPGAGHWGSRAVEAEEPVFVSTQDAGDMLKAAAAGTISHDELVDWANLVLFNDTFQFDGEQLRDVLDRIEAADEPGMNLGEDELGRMAAQLQKNP